MANLSNPLGGTIQLLQNFILQERKQRALEGTPQYQLATQKLMAAKQESLRMDQFRRQMETASPEDMPRIIARMTGQFGPLSASIAATGRSALQEDAQKFKTDKLFPHQQTVAGIRKASGKTEEDKAFEREFKLLGTLRGRLKTAEGKEQVVYQSTVDPETGKVLRTPTKTTIGKKQKEADELRFQIKTIENRLFPDMPTYEEVKTSVPLDVYNKVRIRAANGDPQAMQIIEKLKDPLGIL